MPMRELYFGDNLDILRAQMLDERVELLYLDLARGSHTFRQGKREGGDAKQGGLFGG